MKIFNKHILEAVNRGIKLALDDYEDVESNSEIKSSDVISGDESIKDNIEFWENWVDLGLPSGTLWAKSNIGADCDNYAESWYGDYFAWGETEPKESYTWEKYKFGEATQLTKYCYDKRYSANYIIPRTDNLKELEPRDDIASIIFGNHVHIPTKEQMTELFNYTKQEIKDTYNGIKGLYGILFTGKNGKTIFMPMAGSMESSIKTNTHARYWTSTLSNDDPTGAYYLDCGRDYDSGMILHNNRSYGMSIRPVYDR